MGSRHGATGFALSGCNLGCNFWHRFLKILQLRSVGPSYTCADARVALGVALRVPKAPLKCTAASRRANGACIGQCSACAWCCTASASALRRLQARYGNPPDAIREAKKEIQVKIKSVFNFAALLSSLAIFCAHGRHRGLTTGFLKPLCHGTEVEKRRIVHQPACGRV